MTKKPKKFQKTNPNTVEVKVTVAVGHDGSYAVAGWTKATRGNLEDTAIEGLSDYEGNTIHLVDATIVVPVPPFHVDLKSAPVVGEPRLPTTGKPQMGEQWFSPEGQSWKIVGMGVEGDGSVSLSGPGPCRSMKTISLDELLAVWTSTRPTT